MSDDVKILWLTPDKPDNISVGRNRIADHLEDSGFEVTIRGTTSQTVLMSVREYGDYDVVIGTTRAGAFAGMVLKPLYRCPLIVDHVDPIRQFEETRQRALAALVRIFENVSFVFADQVLFVYEEERERVARYTDRFSKTDLGVEVDRFRDPDSEITSAAKDQFEEWMVKENVAIYVGGLESMYHVEELLQAMTQLSNWSLVVIGDGSLRQQVTNAAAQRNNVHYAGTVPHYRVPGYLQAADLGISLVDDPHTLKVLEYGIAGLPVVQLAGRAESRFGELVEYTDLDPHHIAETIRSTGSKDPHCDLRSFASTYDWRDIADDYTEAITSVM